MKLQQINEMFDNVSLGDDVHINIDTNNYSYNKVIDGDSYFVNATDIDEVPDGFIDDFQSSDSHADTIEDMIRAIRGVWSVDLMGPNTYTTTGRGNFAAVYGFLLGAMQDIIVNHNVNALTFSGMEPGMDHIYDRFIKSYKRDANPAMRFHEVGEDLWISERGLQLIDQDLASYLQEQIPSYNSMRKNILMVSKITKINQKKYGHLIDTIVQFNNTPWRIIAVNRSQHGVIGQLISHDNTTTKKRENFTPEMIKQFEIQP